MSDAPIQVGPVRPSIAAIGPILREFPEGYEARWVREPRAGWQHWVLLGAVDWVDAEMRRLGFVRVPDGNAA
jgi:hypothetical protein